MRDEKMLKSGLCNECKCSGSSVGQSVGLMSQRSRVRTPLRAFFDLIVGKMEIVRIENVKGKPEWVEEMI